MSEYITNGKFKYVSDSLSDNDDRRPLVTVTAQNATTSDGYTGTIGNGDGDHNARLLSFNNSSATVYFINDYVNYTYYTDEQVQVQVPYTHQVTVTEWQTPSQIYTKNGHHYGRFVFSDGYTEDLAITESDARSSHYVTKTVTDMQTQWQTQQVSHDGRADDGTIDLSDITVTLANGKIILGNELTSYVSEKDYLMNKGIRYNLPFENNS